MSKITQRYGANELVKYEYTYDGNNNISSVKENGTTVIEYNYDELNQLYIEDDKTNHIYTHYSYDNAGNIVKVLKRNYNSYGVPTTNISEKTYSYDDTNWKDKLTSYNGEAITYDEMGNPLSYRDGITMTWQNGRHLASLQKGSTVVNYKYDSNGMRTQKSDSNSTTYYYYDSNNNLIGLTKGNNTLLFYYDSDGNVTSFKYNGTMYYYAKNLQGDVVKIISESGAFQTQYTYDAWGSIKSVTGNTWLASLNPFRYRSYVYDGESGLYYLQSRYYDPTTGRFLNADDTAYIGVSGTVLSGNLFTYCENNCINNIDTSGKWFKSLKSYYDYYKKMYDRPRYKRAWSSFKSNYNKLRDRYNYNVGQLGRYSSYILGQQNNPVANMKYGPDSKIKNVGCELVAIYNVLKFIKKFQMFSKIILEAEMNGLSWLGGRFGTKPENIGKYFDAYKIKYSKYTNLDKFKKKIKSSKITIVSVWNNGLFSGIHTYCLYYENKKYKAINYYSNDTKVRAFDLNNIKKNKFIIGYCF